MRRAVALAFVLSVVISGRARADDPDNRDSARALADRGWELFQAGKYDEAIAVLEKAEARHHAPTLLLVLARAHDRAGHLVEARDLYEKLVAENLDAKAPDAFKEAQAAGRVQLEAIRDRVPALELRIRGRNPSEVQIEIDGAIVKSASGTFSLNPGPHRVVATAGSSRVEREIKLLEGRKELVELEFPLPTSAKRGVSRPVAQSDRPSTARGPNVPAIVSFGIAGVALGVGSVTGFMALQRAGDVKDRCIDGHCPPDAQADADSSKRFGNVSTVSFVVAGVAGATGVVFLLVRPGDERPVIRARVSPSFVGLEHVF